MYISIKKETDDLPKDNETTKILKVLDDLATLAPGKNAQLAAKKINEKYKENKRLRPRKTDKLPGKIVKIGTIEKPQGQLKVPVSIEKSTRSHNKAAKNIIKKYDKARKDIQKNCRRQ